MQPSRPSATLLVLLLAVLTLLAACGGDVLEESPETVDATLSPAPTDSSEAKPSKKPKPAPTRTRTRAASPSPSISVPRIKIPKSFDGPVTGGDISWPQCPKGMGIPERPTLGLPMPLESAKYVIIGLTNGPAFTPNPCLDAQVRWVKQRRLMASAYAVTSYPDAETLRQYGDEGPFHRGTRLDALRNVGYQQAAFNIASMKAVGLNTPIVWIDVEPVPDPFVWSSDRVANAAVVEGVARGYVDAGYPIGVYSTPALWDAVVGDFGLGGVPEWRAAGQTSMAEALRRCRDDWTIQGGDGVIGQWVADSRDLNVTCPGTSTQLYRWFHQY